jgi:rubrerythrin
MKDMTKKALEEAFAGESMAHMKYLAFSEIAAKEGKPNLSRMFKAIAYAEQVHAHNHARNLGYLNDSVKNLDVAAGGEHFEITEMYPVYNNTAKFQGEKGAELSTHYAFEAEKIHEQMYKDARKCAEKNEDIKIGAVYICPVCGFTVEEGGVPDFCPVCRTASAKFAEFK